MSKIIIRKKISHPESELQRACVKWFRYQYFKLADMLFAIPNGGKRSPIEAAIMKGEGVRPGVADLFLMIPRHGHAGLWIEMKSESGKQTEYQKRFEDDAISQGYRYRICRTLPEFIEAINSYLK